MDLPARKAQYARAVGNAGLVSGALSLATMFFFMTGEWIVFASVAFAILAVFAGLVGLVIIRRTLSPRPARPAVALFFGLALLAGHGVFAWATFKLAHMH